MPFMCQCDSYLKSATSKVCSVTPNEKIIESQDGKKVKTKGYDVVLDDTILFPEGGGQPDDRGTMNGFPVLRVTRKGAEAIHFVESPIDTGIDVQLQIDWVRRFDHMQQHTGQHLITAITDLMFGFKTTSWDLGKSVSFIELDTPTMTNKQMKLVEDRCNELICKNTRVNVHVTEIGSPMLQSVRARGLPEDHVGSVRIIEIEGVDSNMCCGTHVKNLADLACVKLMSIENGKKGKTNLYFVVGSRVLDHFQRMYENEKGLTKILKCGPREHALAAERNVKQLKVVQKVSTNLIREIAMLEAQVFKKKIADNGERFFTAHRREGTNEYMNIIANELADLNCYLFLTVGEEAGAGLFLLSGPGEFLGNFSKTVSDTISGKGAVKGNRMQGKAGNLKGRGLVLDMIKKYIETDNG